jgi:hypothetical protein
VPSGRPSKNAFDRCSRQEPDDCLDNISNGSGAEWLLLPTECSKASDLSSAPNTASVIGPRPADRNAPIPVLDDMAIGTKGVSMGDTRDIGEAAVNELVRRE